MNAIETTATFEGAAHLRLAHPVEKPVSGEVRVIVLFGETGAAVRGDFRSAIGSYYRDYPGEPVKNSAEWFRELREGERDRISITTLSGGGGSFQLASSIGV